MKSILRLGLINKEENVYTKILSYIFDSDIFVEQLCYQKEREKERERERERERKFACTQGLLGVGTTSGISFCQKFSTLHSLKTPKRRLSVIGHGPHPRNACSSLAVPYILCNAYFQNRFVDFTYSRMYLSTTSAGFIAGQDDILHMIYEIVMFMFLISGKAWIQLFSI